MNEDPGHFDYFCVLMLATNVLLWGSYATIWAFVTHTKTFLSLMLLVLGLMSVRGLWVVLKETVKWNRKRNET